MSENYTSGRLDAAAEAQTLAKAAVDLLNQRQALQALRTVEQCMALGVPQLGLHHLHSVILCMLGRHKEGLAAVERELAANPANAQALAHRNELVRSLSRRKSNVPSEQRPYRSAIPPQVLHMIQCGALNYTYRGVPMIKNPFDFALYPMLIWSVKPRTLIEIGSKEGGSALWFADLMQSFGIDGHVYSVDIVRVTEYAHDRVTFIEGDGRNLGATFSADFLRNVPRPLLVIEDADQEYETSIAVLRFFRDHLRNGEYHVVEDGIISDLTQAPNCNSGPHRAIKEFLHAYPGEYEIDADYCDLFGYNATWCSNGFLRRVSEA